MIIAFFLINKFSYKRPKQNLEIKKELYNILLNNAIIPWDRIAFKHEKNEIKYQEEKFIIKEKEDDLDYYETSLIEEKNEYSKFHAGFNGFNIVFDSLKKSYYLSLHLGTSEDLRMAIYNELKNNFKNVKIEDGNFVQGFNFQLK
jgi:hypothetical protein